MSKSPRAAIIRAASASSPGCAVRTAAGSRRTSSPKPRRCIADGVKELNLISQDSTYYGLDLRPNHSRAISSPEKFTAAVKSLPADATTICTLLRELNALPGDFWIRLLYTHPAHWTDELIQTIAECPKVARYVDIPLQHIHENMLERMRRETSQQYIVDLIRKIRAGVPGIALRTTFIVGFPGETEASFEHAARFHPRDEIRAARRVHLFQGRRHARRRDEPARFPTRSSKSRRELAMAAQHEVAVAGFRILRRPRNQGARRRQSRCKAIASRECAVPGNTALLRERETRQPAISTLDTFWLPAAKPMRRTLTAGFISAASCRSANLPASKSSATRITI